MDLRLRVRSMEKAQVLEIGGEIDLHSAPGLKSELAKLAEIAGALVAVDLSDVTFLDSTGVGTLVGGLKKVRENGGKLVFFGVRPRVKRVLEITGLLRALPIFDNRETALFALQNEGKTENGKSEAPPHLALAQESLDG